MAQMVHPTVVCMFAPSVGIPMDGDSQGGLAVPQLVMLANVALTTEATSGGCDFGGAEEMVEKDMVELKTVGSSGYSDSEDESLAGYGYAEHPEMASVGYQPETPLPVEYAAEEEEEEDVRAEEDTREQQAPCSSPNLARTRSATSGKRKRGPASAEDSKKKKPFLCKPCQYRAENEEDFVRHIRAHGSKKLAAFAQSKGEECPAPATPDSAAAATEDGGAVYSKGVIRCNRCGYNTNRYDHYTAHLKHHSKEGDSQHVYKCTICTYTTISQYHWKKHLRNHFPRKLYTCSQCCYFSDRKNNYVQHIRTHTGERPFQCPHCPYTSSQKTHLTRHMRTHSGEKPFKCDVCSYVAANQHEVTRHVGQVHGGPKPLSCPHCQYKTADRSNYKKHVELHVSPRQFLCPVCSYAASKKCNLQYHIKSRHPGCADITMDVSKVRLRVKNVEAAGKKPQPVLAGIAEEEPEPEREPQGEVAESADDGEKEGDEDMAGPINLSIKKPGRTAGGRVREKEGKEEKSPKEVEVEEGGLPEKGNEGKSTVNTERQPKREEMVEKPRDRLSPVQDKRKERGERKAAKVAVKVGDAEKQAETQASQSEQSMAQGGERTEDVTEPEERDATKEWPKRGRKPGRKSSIKAAAEEEKTKTTIEATEEKEVVKENKNSVKMKSATKRLSRGGKNLEKADKETESPETPPKESKTKVGKRKSDNTDTSLPKEDEILDQTASCTRSKRRKLEGVGSHPDEPEAEHRASKVPKEPVRRRGQRKKRDQLKEETKNVELIESGLEGIEVETEMEKTVESTEPGVLTVVSLEQEGNSKQAQNEDSPLGELQPGTVEDQEEVPELSVQTGGELQHQDMGMEASTKVDSVVNQDKEPEEVAAPVESSLEAKELVAEEDHSVEVQPENVSKKTDTPESGMDSVGTCPPIEEAPVPSVAPGGPKSAEGKKVLPPLELPKAGDKPGDTEEDEGIHSPDGSDISDSVSEGSDDSGLNSAPTGLDTPTEEIPTPTMKIPSTTEGIVTPAKENHTSKEVSHSPIMDSHVPVMHSPSPTIMSNPPSEESHSPTMENHTSNEVDHTPIKDIPTSVKHGPSPTVESHVPLIERHASMKDSPTPTVESHTPTKLTSHTCIFCDRTFPVEVDYRRHLNRHLVNVYYLEDAVAEKP
ncbi:hypothetical protein AGOR_G00193950 [Albula goreensis]|uniref:C2H2-type domain-containing protein n=1 Tax=Albula goreensis TaxID=1534307 RepID=A0A8T3CTV0_9TELE|nr:hypothetical protein AGOR_G00193950 [Albula goreensis]